MDDILVEISSRLPESDGKNFAVTTVENNTVAGLIRKACKENGIVMKTSYSLRDSKGKLLPWSQTLIQCGVKHGDILSLVNEGRKLYTLVAVLKMTEFKGDCDCYLYLKMSVMSDVFLLSFLSYICP